MLEIKKSRYKGKKGFGNDNFNNLGKDRGQNEFRVNCDRIRDSGNRGRGGSKEGYRDNRNERRNYRLDLVPYQKENQN